MTAGSLRDPDADLVRRLEQLATEQTSGRTPWPGLDDAIRSRRNRLLAGAGSVALGLGVLAVVLAGFPQEQAGISPAAPGTGPAAPGGAHDGFGVTFADISMDVPFDVTIGSSEPMPDGEGECAVFDHPLVLNLEDGQRVPSLAAFAAAGCRGGIVGQPVTAPADPARPFAGQPTALDVAPCVLQESLPFVTSGGLTATQSTFDCGGGQLRQWLFDTQLIWSLDGGQRIVDLLRTAHPASGD